MISVIACLFSFNQVRKENKSLLLPWLSEGITMPQATGMPVLINWKQNQDSVSQNLLLMKGDLENTIQIVSLQPSNVCMHVCSYVCVYIYTYVGMCIYIYIYTYVSMCIYIYVSMCIYICMYICIYVCVYICMYIHMQVCVYIYICKYVYIYACIYICVCVYIYVCMCIFVVVTQLLSHVQLFTTPWTIAHQVPLSMEFYRKEYCSRVPFPTPGDLPNPRIKPISPALQADSLLSEPSGKLMCI